MVKTLLLLVSLAQASEKAAPAPLPASPQEEFRVVIDEDVTPKDQPPPPGSPGLKRQGRARLASVDPKERRIILEDEEGPEHAYGVPEAARLTFAADERPLRLEQLRRGDQVAYSVEGPKLLRLHLELPCEAGRRPRRRSRLFDESLPQPGSPDDPDIPMYQSEPPSEPQKRR